MSKEITRLAELEKRRKEAFRNKVENTARENKLFADLPDEIKSIVTEASVEALTIPTRELFKKIVELDELRNSSLFVADETYNKGTLIARVNTFRKQQEINEAKVSAFTLKKNELMQKRSMIAASLTRIRMAEALGYTQGQWKEFDSNTIVKQAESAAFILTQLEMPGR